MLPSQRKLAMTIANGLCSCAVLFPIERDVVREDLDVVGFAEDFGDFFERYALRLSDRAIGSAMHARNGGVVRRDSQDEGGGQTYLGQDEGKDGAADRREADEDEPVFPSCE